MPNVTIIGFLERICYVAHMQLKCIFHEALRQLFTCFSLFCHRPRGAGIRRPTGSDKKQSSSNQEAIQVHMPEWPWKC
jgi:hypothetical protein